MNRRPVLPVERFRFWRGALPILGANFKLIAIFLPKPSAPRTQVRPTRHP